MGLIREKEMEDTPFNMRKKKHLQWTEGESLKAFGNDVAAESMSHVKGANANVSASHFCQM